MSYTLAEIGAIWPTEAELEHERMTEHERLVAAGRWLAQTEGRGGVIVADPPAWGEVIEESLDRIANRAAVD